MGFKFQLKKALQLQFIFKLFPPLLIDVFGQRATNFIRPFIGAIVIEPYEGGIGIAVDDLQTPQLQSSARFVA